MYNNNMCLKHACLPKGMKSGSKRGENTIFILRLRQTYSHSASVRRVYLRNEDFMVRMIGKK